MWNQGSVDISKGLQWLVRGVSAPPFALIQNRTDDFSASFALLRRKALQPFPQTFATFASNVCNLCLKRLHPLPQTFASTCKRPRKALPLSPQAFASSGIRDTPHLISFIPYPCADMPPFSVRMTAKSLSYASESSFGYGLFCRMLLFTYYI